MIVISTSRFIECCWFCGKSVRTSTFLGVYKVVHIVLTFLSRFSVYAYKNTFVLESALPVAYSVFAMIHLCTHAAG